MAERLALAVLALAVAAPAASAKRCSQLHERDLAPAKHVRLVERANGDGGYDLVGCILPRGGLHTMASSTEYEVESSDYSLLDVKREKLMIETSFGDQYGGQSGTYVSDIRTRSTYTVVSQCREILVGFCPGPPGEQESVVASRLNDIGQSAVMLLSPSSVAVVGFSTHGVRTELDRADPGTIAPKSLRLRGSTVSWMHGTERRSFTLSG